ncbi:hypothetical protein [Bdellovibrio bacteriovorus]|uniref:hypothetical protein n=1 Tax=Bdellovibrio bacteriovorus TaxID=959 RepID=UPI00045C150F|nr:hypothetical protein [Bdellovibrio bacteriovorus]AHZ86070.1 hypothetical protein EP01_14180 [Bdellovibrio bacteriovorus]BEV66995.1 hypothetical protein Bb109J_c0415 [Bdellovibrio bacteriovorus]
MSKKSALILSLVAAVLLIFTFCHFYGGSPDEAAEETLPVQDATGVPAEAVAPPVKAEPPPVDVSAAPPSTGFLPTEMEEPGKFAAYQQKLKEMAVCLNMQMNALDPNVEINFETFNQVINPDLGEVVTQSEEWTATDIRTKNGELRRIYIENGPSIEAESSRTLKYEAFSQDGTSKSLPLSKEQTSNPSDALVASLEADGEVVSRSVSRRIFYSNGDDLLLVEKNGKIFSFELTHDGATFRCSGADKSSTFQCQCRNNP